MSKAGGYGLYIATVGKKHCCTGVSQAVKFQVTYIVAFEEPTELSRGRVRVHHVAVLFGKDVVKIFPTVPQVGDMAVLLKTVLCQRLAESFGNGDGAYA